MYRSFSALRFGLPVLVVCFLAGRIFAAESEPRQALSLNGDWLFQRDGAPSNDWKTVVVPSSFQSHEGTNWHGIGWYRRTIPPLAVPAGSRVLLHFDAAATEAEVWFDGERLGSHLGGWTPFRFDVTELFEKNSPGKEHEIRVRLDEKVGHNTQGFLPAIEPHFGGLWQGVKLLTVPETYIDDLSVLATGDPGTSDLRLELPLDGPVSDTLTNASVRYRLRGQTAWTALAAAAHLSHRTLELRGTIPGAKLWSPAAPSLYEVQVSLPAPGAPAFSRPSAPGAPKPATSRHSGLGDRLVIRAAFRSLTAFGPELRLNGRPLNVRGVLNWGYSAPKLEPNPGETVWRKELEFVRAHGFNLMKFCLWVPPHRYLELADEMGVLTWMEYPTWHPKFTEEFLEPLRREFREFFLYDRNHPSVILRSLTCETGTSADLNVIRSLYDSAHALIPGALVEDDSSWIQWNRVHDFYDDHPYGNNDVWVSRLHGFDEYILGHGLKPLVLGETTAADTWIDRPAVLAQLGGQRPWWAPKVIDDMAQWTERMRQIAGPGGLDELRPDSLRYGMLMRKYQIEAFRREVPYGGYVITVLRDFPSCSMGLLDYLGNSKWSAADWQWHGDTICLLQTEHDRRSFASGEALRGSLLLSHFGLEPLKGARLEVGLEHCGTAPAEFQHLTVTNLSQNPGTLAKVASLDWKLPEVQVPLPLKLRAVLVTGPDRSAAFTPHQLSYVHAQPESDHSDVNREMKRLERRAPIEFRNEWPLWVVPATSTARSNVQLHASLAPALAKELFPGCPPFEPGATQAVVVASHFDDQLAHFVESGGRLLLLPDGQAHSFALEAHWFLRGAPYIPEHALSAEIPRDLLLELQHFDLSSEVVPNLPHFEAFDPILMLWDTHDQPSVKTHGLVFETRIGKGRMLVSALRHTGPVNAAGRWLLGVFLNHLQSGPPPRHALPEDVWAYAKASLNAEQTNLASRTWMFKPDPNNEGLALGWQQPELASAKDWKPIRIGAWWESQGYPALDGWAWYRLWVEIPSRWDRQDVFLSFEGVDDSYELYVNGRFVGQGGDQATRQDALNEKKSYNIRQVVRPGQRALLAVRVHDWHGAGGISRPVTLGTLPLHPELQLLQGRSTD